MIPAGMIGAGLSMKPLTRNYSSVIAIRQKSYCKSIKIIKLYGAGKTRALL